MPAIFFLVWWWLVIVMFNCKEGHNFQAFDDSGKNIETAVIILLYRFPNYNKDVFKIRYNSSIKKVKKRSLMVLKWIICSKVAENIQTII